MSLECLESDYVIMIHWMPFYESIFSSSMWANVHKVQSSGNSLAAERRGGYSYVVALIAEFRLVTGLCFTLSSKIQSRRISCFIL